MVDDNRDAIFSLKALLEMEGYELARRLRQLEATSKAVLVAATGFGQPQDRARSSEAGIDYHLVKPADLAALRGILQRTPRGRQE